MSQNIVKITSAHIRAALTLRYPTGSHALLWEVANGTGTHQKRFADAVAIGLWPSHGHEIEGIEIKISRGDWLNELKQPEKSQEVYQYCNRWWLAAPKGMVEVDELPQTWGLLELVTDTIRVKKRAPALTPSVLNINFVAALIRRSAGVDEEMTRLMLRREAEIIERRVKGSVEQTINSRVSHRIQMAEDAMKKLDEIKQRTGIDLTHYTPTDDWVAAINYLCSTSRHNNFNADVVKKIRADALRLADSLSLLPCLKNEVTA